MHFKQITALCCALFCVSSTAASAVNQQTAGGPAEFEANLSSHHVQVNGEPVNPQAYLIAGHNFYKLRDIAYLLSGTSVSFDLTWDNDSATIDILPGNSYTEVGGEMCVTPVESPVAQHSTSNITLNGENVLIEGYCISGNNYYKIADLASELGFQALFDNDTYTVNIVTPELEMEDPPEMDVLPLSDTEIETGTELSSDTQTDSDSDDTDSDGETDASSNDKDTDSETDVSSDDTKPSSHHRPARDPELGDESDVNSDTDPDEETELPTEPEREPRVSQLDGVRTVIVDAGHGGGDLGAQNIKLGLDEKHVNLYVAEYLKEYLEDAGVKVIMVRDRVEEGEDLTLRGDVMTEYVDTVDLFFGLHHNAATTEARGAQVLAQIADEDTEDGPSKILAEELNKEYEKLGLTVRKIWFRHGDNGDYYYTNRKAAELQITAVISEFCFIDNEEDVKFIDSEEDWQAEAHALCAAILRYFEQVEY